MSDGPYTPPVSQLGRLIKRPSHPQIPPGMHVRGLPGVLDQLHRSHVNAIRQERVSTGDHFDQGDTP